MRPNHRPALETIIADVEAYCQEAGIQPSTLTLRVLNNSRFLERIKRKLEKADKDAQKLRAFMQQNPPGDLSQVGGQQHV